MFRYLVILGLVIVTIIATVPSLTVDAQMSPTQVWHDSFCHGEEVCLVGDFNGDGADDIATFVRNTKSGDEAGDVWVALSVENSFGEASVWHDTMCFGDEVCAVGDFNGDGKDDIASFVRSSSSNSAGNVRVALSTGSSFGQYEDWLDSFCYGDEVCAVGDFNGDGKDDIAAFVRSSKTGDIAAAGDVWISLSTGNGFGQASVWHNSFCYDNEVCAVGDFDGNGKDDVIAFSRNAKTGDAAGDVWVALSSGDGFGQAYVWQDSFCYGDEVCMIGDFNGDGRDDITTFTRSWKTDESEGDVWVTISDGDRFGTQPMVYHNYFCVGEEICNVGDFDGDGFADLIVFVRSTKTDNGAGDVLVSLDIHTETSTDPLDME